MNPKTEVWTADFADSTDYEEVMILDFCKKKVKVLNPQKSVNQRNQR